MDENAVAEAQDTLNACLEAIKQAFKQREQSVAQAENALAADQEAIRQSEQSVAQAEKTLAAAQTAFNQMVPTRQNPPDFDSLYDASPIRSARQARQSIPDWLNDAILNLLIDLPHRNLTSPPEWINDNTITRVSKTLPTPPDVHIFEATWLVQHMQVGGTNYAPSSRMSKQGIKVFVAPLEYNNHWSLIAFVVSTKRIWHFDSLHGCQPQLHAVSLANSFIQRYEEEPSTTCP